MLPCLVAEMLVGVATDNPGHQQDLNRKDAINRIAVQAYRMLAPIAGELKYTMNEVK